jgi:hypothetical protein
LPAAKQLLSAILLHKKTAIPSVIGESNKRQATLNKWKRYGIVFLGTMQRQKVQRRADKATDSKTGYKNLHWWLMHVVIPLGILVVGTLIATCIWKFACEREQPSSGITAPVTEEGQPIQLEMRTEGDVDSQSGEKVYEFDLFSNSDRVAVVSSIKLQVLEIEPQYTRSAPDHPYWASGLPHLSYIAGPVDVYEYHILLNHDVVRDYTITNEPYKYVRGDFTKHIIKVLSDKPGWNYKFYFIVNWYDPGEQGERILYSDTYIVRFYSDGI